MSQEEIDIPGESDPLPSVPGTDLEIRFHRRQAMACLKACCRQADFTLAPNDVIRLKRLPGLASTEFLEDGSQPFPTDDSGVAGGPADQVAA